MKRARLSSTDSDANSADSASGSCSLAKSPSLSSPTSSSAVEEFEEPPTVPLLSILSPVLHLLREREVFADALKRLAKEKSGDLDQLTELHSTAMVQYELVLMNMTREAILLKAIAEAQRSGASLPHAWKLRWTARPSVEHGPFTNEVVQQWSNEGFFSKKEGELRDINAVNSTWVPASKVIAELQMGVLRR